MGQQIRHERTMSQQIGLERMTGQQSTFEHERTMGFVTRVEWAGTGAVAMVLQCVEDGCKRHQRLSLFAEAQMAACVHHGLSGRLILEDVRFWTGHEHLWHAPFMLDCASGHGS
eukprot:1158855-Pelagomonas_calceolata.AAC.16